MGRNVPLRVWGPSGATPELGTAYALEHMQKMLSWDLAGRAGNVDFRGYVMDVTEFDYKGENQVVYEDNGVTIRSFPAIHSIDGSVSYSLEWNGLKFVFSSDTYPNKWFDQYARDADLLVHECFIAVPELVSKMGFTPESALLVGTQVHTAPEAFGKVMGAVKPRMAVAYHFFKDFDTTSGVHSRIRSTYDGPLSLAEDYMVWNVTKDDIKVRLAEVDHNTWAPPLAAPAELPKQEDKTAMAEKLGVETIDFSDFTKAGFWDVDDVLRPIYEEASQAVGREFPTRETQRRASNSLLLRPGTESRPSGRFSFLFLLTGVLGTTLTQYYMVQREKQSKKVEMATTRKASIAELSALNAEYLAHAEMSLAVSEQFRVVIPECRAGATKKRVVESVTRR
jgi:ribonuclease Z